MRRISVFMGILLVVVGLISYLVLPVLAALPSHVLYSWLGSEGTHVATVAKYWNENYAGEYGFKVKVIQVGRDDFFAKVATMIPSETDTWQAYMVFNWMIPSFAEGGYLVPFDEYYKNPDYFLPTYTRPMKWALDLTSYKGSIYGVPQDACSEGLLRYRADLIDRLLTDANWKAKYGKLAKDILGKDLEPKHPDEWNWDDYLATAIFLTKKYNPDSPTEYGTVFEGQSAYGVQFAAYWAQILVSFGGAIVDADGRPAVDSPEGLQSISYLLDLHRKYGVVPPDIHKYEAFEEFTAFQSGKVAFGLDWDWDTLLLVDKTQSPLVWDKMKQTLPPEGPGGRAAYVQEFAWTINNYTSEQAKKDMTKFLFWASSSRESVKMGRNIWMGTYIPDLFSPEEGYSQEMIDHYRFIYEKLGKEVELVHWPLVPAAVRIYAIISNQLGRALNREISDKEALETMQKEMSEALVKKE